MMSEAKTAAPAKTPWWKNTSLLASVAALVTGILGSVVGADVGAENVSNVVFGGAAAVGGGVLAFKGGKAIWLIVQAKRGGGQ